MSQKLNIPGPIKKYGIQVLTWMAITLIAVFAARFGLEGAVTVEQQPFPQPPIEIFFPTPEPTAVPDDGDVTYGYQTKCYMTDGGDKQECVSGGEIELRTGATFDLQTGATATMAGTTNFSGGTVTNLSMSGADIVGDLVVTGTALIDGAADADQLTVQGWTTQTSFLQVWEQSAGTNVATIANGGDLVVTSTVFVDGATDTDQFTIQGWTTQTNDLQVWEQSDGTDVGTFTNAGVLDIASTINYGTDNLYPLGYASASQQIECGVTATFTDTVAVTASALTTATYVIATQITDPAATAAILTVDAPAANVFNVDSWESDYSVGTTGITVYWCAVGNQ